MATDTTTLIEAPETNNVSEITNYLNNTYDDAISHWNNFWTGIDVGVLSETQRLEGIRTWSSYRSKIGLALTPNLVHDLGYQSLGLTPTERVQRYRDWVQQAIPKHKWEHIRQAIQMGDVTGSDRFRDDIANKLEIRLTKRQRGRPKKEASNSTWELFQ